jgi:proteasome lid subunit RPN8/RPN11
VKVTVPSSALDAIAAHAREAAPAECCGVLIGRDRQIVEAVRCRNLSDDPNRFLIDPQDHFDVMRRARAAQLDVVGFYHSHPNSNPEPSPSDRAEASYPDHLYLIVGLRGAPEFRLYQFRDGVFEAAAIETDH